MQKQATKPDPVRQVDHTYTGKFSDQQIHGNSHNNRRYGIIQHDSLNNYQNFLYNRALYGLAVYSKEEIKEMRWDKRKRILKVHQRSQKVLNLWKQRIVIDWSNQFFKKLFPKASITQALLNMTETDSEYVTKMSFSDLGITKAQVISKLVAEGILPPEFYTLKQQTTCK